MSENRFQIRFKRVKIQQTMIWVQFEDTAIICFRKSVPNTFQTGQNTTDNDLGVIQTTVDDTTGKQPNCGSSKITLTNNN